MKKFKPDPSLQSQEKSSEDPHGLENTAGSAICQPPLEVPTLRVQRPDSPTSSSPFEEWSTSLQQEVKPQEPGCQSSPKPQFPASHITVEPAPPPEPQVNPEPDVNSHTPLDEEAFWNFMLFNEDDKEFEVEPNLEDIDDTPPLDADKRNGPLYKGAKISLHESMVSILTLALSFKISGVCLQAILQLISLHLPSPNNFRVSLQSFKDYFSFMQGPKTYKYYCSKCFEECEANTACSSCKNSKLCCLVTISLIDQLQAMFKRKGFYSKLNFECRTTTDNISDVYDGQLYQEQVKKNFLGREGALSFQWYTDGAALYKSSKVSVWPVYLTIDQLPYSERYKKENLLVPCIWVGPVKPPGNLLQQAMFTDLKSLYSGVKLDTNPLGEKVIKGVLLSGTGDTPARSIMLNMVQYNGESSCQVCEQSGEPRPKVPGVRLFPFKPEEMVPRTLSGMIDYGNIGTPEKPYRGVKGHCFLSKLMPDFVRGTAADPMHGIYGGAGKKLLKLWTTTQKKDSGKWSISGSVNIINQRLLNIKPPLHTPRTPQPLQDLAYYKMSQLKAWFNEYSLPVLKKILPESYFIHHATLVAAVQLLSADIVSNESLSIAKELLTRYIDQFADFYDPRYMTINFHLLLHLAEIVEALGPMWVFTCFPLEHLNGVILSLVHGTRWAERQIASSIQTCLSLPTLIADLPDNSLAKKFCVNLVNRRKYKGKEVIDGTVIVGLSKLVKDSPYLPNQSPYKYSKMYKLNCIKRDTIVYTAMSNTLLSACRDSSAVRYIDNGNQKIGIIVELLHLFQCSCKHRCLCQSSIVVVVQELRVIEYFKTLIPGVFVPNVHGYSKMDSNAFVDPRNLRGVCTKMLVDELYIAQPLNSKEVE